DRSTAALGRLGARQQLVVAILHLGETLAAANRPAPARRTFEDALAMALELGAVPLALEALCALAAVDGAGGGLTLAWVAGHPACPARLRRRAEARWVSGGEDLASATPASSALAGASLAEVARRYLPETR